VCGIDERREQRWNIYALSVLAFSLVSVLALYALLRFQGSAAAQPRPTGAVPAPLAFNTAVSFVTNTNWQNYGGELDDEPPHPDGRAGGAELRVADRRALRGRGPHPGPRPSAGVDRRQLLGRPRAGHDSGSSCPSRRRRALVLVSQGVIQNFHGFTEVTTLEGAAQ
jgi:K+-transporting ATPase ATPase A chain